MYSMLVPQNNLSSIIFVASLQRNPSGMPGKRSIAVAYSSAGSYAWVAGREACWEMPETELNGEAVRKMSCFWLRLCQVGQVRSGRSAAGGALASPVEALDIGCLAESTSCSPDLHS